MPDLWPLGVDRDSVLALAPGDVVAVLLFVAAGEVRHHLPPWEFPERYVMVAVPFLVGWALAGPALGAYVRHVRESAPRAVVATVVAWLVADAVAMSLRDTAWFPGGAHVDLYLVAAGVGGGLLVAWRLTPFAWRALRASVR